MGFCFSGGLPKVTPSGRKRATGEYDEIYSCRSERLTVAALTVTGAAAQATCNKVGSEAGGTYMSMKNTNGCLMAKDVGTDNQIQMGVSETTGLRGYMALYTKESAEVDAGEKVSVLFDVDGQKFTGIAAGVEMESFDGAYVHFNNPDFICDLAKKKSMTITPQGVVRSW
jgi:hypothetical protein